jgi:hypothetical protein
MHDWMVHSQANNLYLANQGLINLITMNCLRYHPPEKSIAGGAEVGRVVLRAARSFTVHHFVAYPVTAHPYLRLKDLMAWTGRVTVLADC